ncbi:uncharacterized protein LOC144703328 [Wolffia australiana]
MVHTTKSEEHPIFVSMSPIRVLSESIVYPSERAPAEGKSRCELSPWDLALVSFCNIQYGLLFSIPSGALMENLVERVTSSLSTTLTHFRPLAGRLSVDKHENGGGISVYIDCDDRGAAFRLAAADGVYAADVEAKSEDVPAFLSNLFLRNDAINYDGVSLHLLAVQLTKLEDGVFLSCSFNHVVGDGTAFWNFFNAWAEISRSQTSHLRLRAEPVLDRWFPDGFTPPTRLPFAHEDEFIQRISAPPLRDKFFRFSAVAIARLKAEANDELGSDKISSLQALTACMWRCITRARRIPEKDTVQCGLIADDRRRLSPRLPETYFGCAISPIIASATAGELLSRGVGWAAELIHEAVTRHGDETIREELKRWMEAPIVYTFSIMEACGTFVGSSPRFDKYGCDFGWGRPVAVRSGIAEKHDGVILAYPGRKGGGAIDFEVSLSPEAMALLELDPELSRVVSLD